MLSKSDFLVFLDCPLHLWAAKHGKYRFVPDPAVRFLMHQGYEVEAMAVEYLTNTLGIDGSRVLIQKTVKKNGLVARADLWYEKIFSNQVDVYEVKSGTRIKKKNLWDLAFQKYVYRDFEVHDLYVVHPDREYVKQGELDVSQFLAIEKVTDELEIYFEQVEGLVKQALRVIGMDNPGGLEGCGRVKDCPVPELCFGKVPEKSVYYLKKFGKVEAEELINDEVDTMDKIKDVSGLGEYEKKQIESVKTNKSVVNLEALKKWLESLKFPLYFLDYETINFAIPKYDGHSAHEHVPFQYSLHALPHPDGALVHTDFIETTKDDPIDGLVNDLQKNIGDDGSVLVWYKHFEIGRNKFMGRVNGKLLEFLESLNARIVDLMVPFAKGVYVDWRFRGSVSIKNVLPILVPELSYKDLAIGDGGMALASWYKMVYGGVEEEEKEYLKKSLLEYCKMDTLAMVRIWEKLVETVK